jgi:tetratricopeptide (TPR) repeat protein
LEIDPANRDGWTRDAAARAVLGDLEDYRRTCAQIARRFGDATDKQSAERCAKACLLMPDALDGADFNRVQKLAELAVAGTEKDGLFPFFAMVKGLADYRAGRHADAIRWMEVYAPRVNATHYDAAKFSVIAMAQYRLGHSDKALAARDNAQAIMAKMPDLAKGQLLDGDWHDWVHAQVLSREAESLLEESRATRRSVAQALEYVRLSQWDKAAAAYANVELWARPLREDLVFARASLYVIQEDSEGYNRFCQDMLQRVPQTADHFEAFVLVRTCTMGRQSPVDPAQAVQWAKQAVAGDQLPWYFHALGLAQYRAGQFDEALQSFSRANVEAWGCRDLNWFGMALVHHRLGHPDKARESLDKGIQWLERGGSPSPQQPANIDPQDWLEAHVLRREAEDVLKLKQNK